MSDIQMIADELQRLRMTFLPAATQQSGVEIDAENVAILVHKLSLLSHLYQNVAQELVILRETEASRLGRTCVEELATAEVTALIVDPEGKVIRPDFGRKQ